MIYYTGLICKIPNLNINLINRTYFVCACVVCRYVISCTFNCTFKTFNLVIVGKSNLMTEINAWYKMTSSSICSSKVQEPSEDSRVLWPSSKFSNWSLFLLYKKGFKTSQMNTTVTERNLTRWCVEQYSFMTTPAALQTIDTCTLFPRAQDREAAKKILTDIWVSHSMGPRMGADGEKECHFMVKNITADSLLP